MALEELRLIDEQIGRLDQEMASLLSEHQDAVQRLAEVPESGPEEFFKDRSIRYVRNKLQNFNKHMTAAGRRSKYFLRCSSWVAKINLGADQVLSVETSRSMSNIGPRKEIQNETFIEWLQELNQPALVHEQGTSDGGYGYDGSCATHQKLIELG